MLRSVTSILTKLKHRKNKSIFSQLQNERHFGECDINMTRQGDFALKVKLYPYEPKQITVNIDHNIIILNAEMKKAEKTVQTITRPDIAGLMFKRSVSMTTSQTTTKEFTLPIEVEPSSVQTKFEDAKIKNSSRLPSVQNVRYFTDEEMEVSKKGDILLKVKLHPFKENEVNYRREGNIVTLEVNSNNVSETVEEVKPPPHSYTGGQKAFQTSKISKSNYAAVTYKLPLDVNEKSIKTKFENGYFILTGYLND